MKKAPSEQTKRVIRCRNDGTPMQETLGEIEYQMGDNLIVFSRVPMHVCPQCGEQYVAGPLGVKLGEIAESVRKDLERPTAWDEIVRSRRVLFELKTPRQKASTAA